MVNILLRGAVFDFDGVIVDSHAVHKRAWKKFLESVGRETSEEELELVSDGRKRDDILRHFLGEMNHETMVEYGHQKERLFQQEVADVQIVAGLVTFLEDLEAAQLALSIASSGSRSRVEFLLRRLGLEKHFRVVVTGDQVERGKPDPALFFKVARDLRLLPSELTVFEDALSGVIAAKAAGMACVGITQPDRASILVNAGADHVASDFRSLSYSKLQEILGSSAR